MVEEFLFIGNRTGKTNSPIRDKGGRVLTDCWSDYLSSGTLKDRSIVVVDKRGAFSGEQGTFQ